MMSRSERGNLVGAGMRTAIHAAMAPQVKPSTVVTLTGFVADMKMYGEGVGSLVVDGHMSCLLRVPSSVYPRTDIIMYIVPG